MVASCCARILLSVLRTLVHGAFPWLQPRSPVVQEVVESGPDRPDAVAVVPERDPAEEVRAVHANPHAVVAAAGSRPRLGGKVEHASLRAARAAARPDARVVDARAADARAVAGARAAAADVRAVDVRVAGVLAGAPSHRWHASSALRRVSSSKPPVSVSAPSIL